MAGVMGEWEKKRGRERNFIGINREKQKKKKTQNPKAEKIQELCVIRKAVQWKKLHKAGTFFGFRTVLKAMNYVNVLQ